MNLSPVKTWNFCFPQHSAEEREKMIAENFRSLGMALVETGMAWFWPDSRVRKWFDVEGLDNLKRAQMQNRGVMVVGVHFMSLELGGRVMGLCQPMMATYRPHNNQLMEWVQTRGRMRSNKAMIGRNNLRGIVGALKKGEAVWFAPDQDYGRKGSSFAPFFAVENVATTEIIKATEESKRPSCQSAVIGFRSPGLPSTANYRFRKKTLTDP